MTVTATPTPRALNYPVGVMLGLLAGLSLSSGGFLLRSIEDASGWQILVYRSGAFTIFLLTIIAIQNRGRIVRPFLSIGWAGVGIALSLGTGFAVYVFAILNTSVANVMFVLASAPVLSAILGRFVLGERLRWYVWIMIVLSLAGIAIMVASDMSPGRLLGNILAFVAAMTFAITIVLIRQNEATDMLPATCLGGVVAFATAAVFVQSFTISQHDMIVSVLLGTVQVGVGFICFTYAPRYILAAEVALLGLLEPVLAPVWVWLAFGEVPSQATLYGGGLVMACIIAFTFSALFDQRRRA